MRGTADGPLSHPSDRGVHVSADNADDVSEDRSVATSNLLKRIASALEITDLIALMMVVVTGLTAYATWKTAQVTNEILLTSQRPYIGTESVSFAVISVVFKVKGKPLPDDFEPRSKD